MLRYTKRQCTGKESVEIKDLDTLMERMERPQLTAMGFAETLEVGRIGGCESEIYRLVCRNWRFS